MRAIRLALIAALLAGPASAQQTSSGHLTACALAKPSDNICRVMQVPDTAEIVKRLGDKETVWWREGDQFSVAARRPGDEVRICCALQEPMAHVPGTDLWALTIRSPHLDSAIFDIVVIANGKPGGARIGMPDQWRGPKAPLPPQALMFMSGHVETIEIDSPNLGEKRKVAVYMPAGHSPANRYPVVYMADGSTVFHFASILDPLIAAKKVPAIILVGLYSGQGFPVPDDSKLDRRNADYLIGRSKDDAFFLKHETFFLKEVMPLAERRFGASPKSEDRMLFGRSSGASWAVDTALRHSELFSRAAGLSVCWRDRTGYRRWGPDKPKLFLAGGLFEDCGENTAKLAEAAKAAGEDVAFETHASGHSSLMWDVQFVDALSWAYGAR